MVFLFSNLVRYCRRNFHLYIHAAVSTFESKSETTNGAKKKQTTLALKIISVLNWRWNENKAKKLINDKINIANEKWIQMNADKSVDS